MKRSLLYSLCIAVLFASCKKDDDYVFDKSPDERINEILAEYQSALVNAPHGWRGVIAPSLAQGGVFSFYFKFNNENRVEMFSDFDSLSSVTPMTSSYRLKALQQPSLIFDTYSYVHVLADPDARNNGGAWGWGLGSDFEFAIEGMSGDTIKLVGRFNRSKAFLVKATQQEAQDYYDKKYGTRVFDNFRKYLNYFKRIVTPEKEYQIRVNQFAHSIAFEWFDNNGTPRKDTVGYTYTQDGIAFVPALHDGDRIITGLTDMTWDEANTRLSFKVNGASAHIIGLGKPINPDLDAPRRWWQTMATAEEYWLAWDGFHKNGIDDYFGLNQLDEYVFLIFWPEYNTSGGITYDLVAPVKFNGVQLRLEYGHAYRKPNFTSDGRAIFSFLGTLPTIPSSDSAAVNGTRLQFMEPEGYYLVQTGPQVYDMVNAKDGLAWITWEPFP
jgi:hypothetical protein